MLKSLIALVATASAVKINAQAGPPETHMFNTWVKDANDVDTNTYNTVMTMNSLTFGKGNGTTTTTDGKGTKSKKNYPL